jgi:hypothetical protein
MSAPKLGILCSRLPTRQFASAKLAATTSSSAPPTPRRFATRSKATVSRSPFQMSPGCGESASGGLRSQSHRSIRNKLRDLRSSSVRPRRPRHCAIPSIRRASVQTAAILAPIGDRFAESAASRSAESQNPNPMRPETHDQALRRQSSRLAAPSPFIENHARPLSETHEPCHLPRSYRS